MRKERVILQLIVFLLSGLLFEGTGVARAEDGKQIFLTIDEDAVQQRPCSAILEATGVGKAPRGRSPAQARLLAERAAKVQAYRNLIRSVDRLSPLIQGEAGIVASTGFIHGVKVVEKIYLPGGRVKIRMIMNLNFANTETACDAWIMEKIKMYNIPVFRVDRKIVEVSERDWIELNQ